ncbi:MAG: hypothetical protein IJ583_09685 [Firmicutes bacterium]|nr:hypothetical protein [Bacillota bacterium]
MKLKNILSKGLIAGVVLATTMAVSAVSAFATDYNDAGKAVVSVDGKEKTWTFNTNLPTADINLKANDTLLGIKCTAEKLKYAKNSTYLSFNGGAIEIGVPQDSAGTITFSNTNTSGDRSITCVDTNTTIDNETAKGSNSFSFSSDNSTDEVIKFSSTKESKITEITVTLTTGAYPLATTYAVTGKCNLSSATFTLTDGTNNYEAEVDASGNFTVSTQDATKAFSTEKTYSAVLDKYTTIKNISLSTEDNVNFTISTALTFNEISLAAAEANTYTTYARPNFDCTPSSGDSNSKWDKNQGFSFKTSAPALVTIEVKSGTSTSGKKTVIDMIDSSEKVIAKSSTVNTSETKTDSYFLPKADTYKFIVNEKDTTANCYINSVKIEYVNSANVTNGILASDGTDMYVIAKIPSTTNLANYENINLGGNTSETIYKAVKIGTTTYGNDGNYYYAVKVSPASVANAGDNITNFMYKLTSVSK